MVRSMGLEPILAGSRPAVLAANTNSCRSAQVESSHHRPVIGRMHRPLCYGRLVGVAGIEPA